MTFNLSTNEKPVTFVDNEGNYLIVDEAPDFDLELLIRLQSMDYRGPFDFVEVT